MKPSQKYAVLATLAACATWITGGILSDKNVLGGAGGFAMFITGAVFIVVAILCYLNDAIHKPNQY